MKITALAAAALAAAGAVGIVGTSVATADEGAVASTQSLGSQAKIVHGDNVQGWTVTGLKPSSDAIPYPVEGTLWEATATDEAIQGGATPIVSNFNARSSSGQTYRALYQVATPQGVNPATLNPGGKTTGKIYFDVTGDAPNSVVYIDAAGNELATWVESQSQGRSGGSTSSRAANSNTPAQSGTPGTANPAGNPAASGSQGTPIPAGTPGNQPATGSGVTPVPAGTPAGSGAAGTPAEPGTAAGTPAAPGAAGTPAAPGTAGSEAAPGTAGAPEAPATAGSPEAPAGSQGTPGSAGTPEAPGTAGSPDTSTGQGTPGANPATPAGSQNGSTGSPSQGTPAS
ncbi:Immunogenic protein MPT63 [Mycobacterium shimoidei]|uniref:Immunogenic protein MPT63 n=1 Tax=Mycobacterium shimoidei TaxID=29313 RepID=A0A375YW07_MYCSH|nr:MPT63 family protein [Mycobacterium shimoidei]SRX92880.1 Immunogenic protein MPT63 [Mycobacterium shimoidei]